MVFTEGGDLDSDEFWHTVVHDMGATTGGDWRCGRRLLTEFRRCAECCLQRTGAELMPVDTAHCPRAHLAAILRAWRDGYATYIAECSKTLSLEQVRAHMASMLKVTLDIEGAGYLGWVLPVVSAWRRVR